jgi:ATP-binding cassette subfamily A (ABC1) protein 3
MINGSFPLANNFAVGRVANWSLRYQQFSVADSLWLMVVGGLNLLIIGMYLEFALPKEYGKRRHPCFFLMCCCNGSKKKTMSEALDQSHDENHEIKYLNPDNYEGVAPEIKQKEYEDRILKISDLEKVYSNGFKAVN